MARGAIGFAVACLFAAARAEQLVANNQGLLLDAEGRVRIFHGVNAVEKEAPYLPTTGEFNTENSLTEEDAQRLQSWGFNMVRLGVMWPAVMPSPNEVNTTYLSEVQELVSMLSTFGISSLLDMHQDILSPYLCGEGMPDWVFDKALSAVGFNRSSSQAFPAPLRVDIPDGDDGYPDVSACQANPFFNYYFSFESEAAWHGLYSSSELWELMADHWEAVATHLKGTPGLLGYELINEPWSSRGDGDSWRVFSDSHTLLPLYQRVHDRIRSVDDDTLIFFEPLVLDGYISALKPTDFPVGGPAGEAYANRSVFSYHSYCPSNDDGSPAYMPLCHAVIIPEIWAGVKKNLGLLQTGGFLTEFGAVGDDEDSLTLLRLQTGHADRLFQGWSYWTYKSFDDITTQNSASESFFDASGDLQQEKAKALSRTYAPAIAGHPQRMYFSPDTAEFELSFAVDSKVSSVVSQIFLQTDFYYKDGYTVRALPARSVSWRVSGQGDGWVLLEVEHSSDLTDGTQVTVTISPCSSASGVVQNSA